MRKYYNLKPLLDCKCNWMILFGMRSNGKSYAVKKYALEDAYNNGVLFVYLRRWSEDIKAKEVNTYFDDAPVKDITGGEWEGVTAWQGFFYWYRAGEGDKVIRSMKPIGRYCSLNQAERYKSQVFNNYGNILFEEFLTNKIYLGGSGINSEPRMLMAFVSTVARDRDINVFLIGNTISRVCPYFSEYGLHGVMDLKPGKIQIYHLKGENGVVDIAVENCEVVETKSRMFFGSASKQIISGEWEVNDVPKLLKPYEYYNFIYEVKVIFSDFRFILQLMIDPNTGGPFVYIYPDTKDRKIKRIITDQFHTDPMISNGLKSKSKAECLISKCFSDGKVCYSDNLTGTDFQQVLKTYNFKGVVA